MFLVPTTDGTSLIKIIVPVVVVVVVVIVLGIVIYYRYVVMSQQPRSQRSLLHVPTERERERETGRRENLGTRLMSQVIRESGIAYSVIRGNQRPNVSKYVWSVSNGFLYALEDGLVNLELL